jgi:putative Mg2+ transporter-C (MgtC) family protein
VCRTKSEKKARAQIVQYTGGSGIALHGVHSAQSGDDEITLTVRLLMEGHTPAARLESLVSELSLQTGIHAVQWYSGDQAQTG